MRRMIRISILFLVVCALFAVSVLASDEPGAASVEPAEAESVSFEVTFLINGTSIRSAEISCSVDGNSYSFSLKDLLDAFGMKMSFDEETRVLSVAPKAAGLMADVLERSLSDRGNADKAPTKPSKSVRREILSDIPADGLMANVLEHGRRAPETAETEPPAENVPKAADTPVLTPAAARERPIGAFFRTSFIA